MGIGTVLKVGIVSDLKLGVGRVLKVGGRR